MLVLVLETRREKKKELMKVQASVFPLHMRVAKWEQLMVTWKVEKMVPA